MARFNPKTYDPRNDSSDGAEDFYTDSADEPGFLPDETVVLIVADGETRLCACGCGREPLGAKSEFLMGHDAKLKGKLIRAHLMGVEVAVVDGGGIISGAAYGFAADRDWVHFLAAADARKLVGKTLDVKFGRWVKPAKVLSIGEGTAEVEKEDGTVTTVKMTALAA